MFNKVLNKNGKGILYFGVRNDGEIVGQQIGDRTLREISQGIANAIKPQIIPTIIMELCDEIMLLHSAIPWNEVTIRSPRFQPSSAF